MTPKKINIAIIGFGNIGSYFYKILEKNKKMITTKTGKVPFIKLSITEIIIILFFFLSLQTEILQ